MTQSCGVELRETPGGPGVCDEGFLLRDIHVQRGGDFQKFQDEQGE